MIKKLTWQTMAFAAAATLAFTGCTNERSVHTDPLTVDPLVGDWVLQGGTGPEGPFKTSRNAMAELNIEPSGDFHGTVGCNSISGKITVSDGEIDIGEPVVTEMACEGPAMTLEAAYLPALLEVTNGKIAGRLMDLEGPHTKIHYARQP